MAANDKGRSSIVAALCFGHVTTRGNYFLIETHGNGETEDMGENKEDEFVDMKNEAGKEEIGGGNLMTWTEYHLLETIEAYMNYLIETFPDWVSTDIIGDSFERRSMSVPKVCRGGCGASAGASKPAIGLDGGIHAREWISPAVVTYIMMELVEHDSSHPHLTKELDWYFLANVNPDGYAYTTCGGKMSVDCLPDRVTQKTEIQKARVLTRVLEGRRTSVRGQTPTGTGTSFGTLDKRVAQTLAARRTAGLGPFQRRRPGI